MARLAEYLRRSSPGEEDKNYSIENQHDDVVRWNGQLGHVLARTYTDPGGKSDTLNRPVFQQMMAEAKAGLFDIVAVGRWDRFSRNQDQQAVAVYQLQQYGVKVVSVTQPTPDGPIGVLIRNNYAFAAELELYNIRERTTNGKKARVRKGKLPPLAYPLYGYRFADPDEPHGKSRYLADPETSAIVKRIFEMVVSGVKIRAIVRQFAHEGVPTPTQVLFQRGQMPTGRSVSPVWRTSTLHRILTNRAYIGKLAGWHTTTITVEKPHPISGSLIVRKRIVQLPDDDPDRVDYSTEVCPALVDEDLFEAVQVILRRNKEESVRNLRDPQALLLRNGFAVCGYCGGHLVAVFIKADNRYRYLCTRAYHHPPCSGGKFSWRADYLDDITWRWVIHNFEHPDVIRKKYEQWKAERDAGMAIEYDRLAAYQEAIARAEIRKHNFMESAGEARNEEMRAEWSAKANQEAQRARELQQEFDQLALVLNQHEGQDGAIESLVALGERARDHLRAATFDDKRTMLHAFKVCVRCWSKDHTPKFEFSWGFDALHERWVQRHLFNNSDSVHDQ